MTIDTLKKFPPAKWVCPTCGHEEIVWVPVVEEPTHKGTHLKVARMVSTPIPQALRQREYRRNQKANA